MDALLLLALVLPAAGALAARLAGRWTGPVAVTAATAGAAPAWIVLAAAAGGERRSPGLEWIPAGELEVGLRLDPLSAAMAATVATVGLVVVVYSTGYFAGSRRAPHALAGILAFLAAMQGLVLADGYLTLLIFWELVGMLSARLIAWSREDPDAPGGAVRAFLVTRTADFGLYAAVIALYGGAGTLAFGAGRPEGALGALVGGGLVLAAMGKSAQAPLQTWLMGAMAGPTPVSALLHSATMVAAGVYLVVRSDGLLAGWPLEVAGWVGAVTAVAAAVIALGQSDLKRVLAASTSSQLGLMFVGAAAGGPAVAVFHLVTHAAAKPALFLAAGIFQRGRGTTDLGELEGAGRDDRAAFGTFALGAAAIAAVPPLALFWSKEAITAASEKAELAWLVLVLVAAAGSAAYMLRPALILWRGGSGEASGAQGAGVVARRGAGAAARHDRPAMLAGCLFAATGAAGLGFLGEPLTRLLGEPPLPASTLTLLLSLGALGIGLAAVTLRARVPGALRRIAERELYIPTLLDAAVRRPALAAGRALARADDGGIDAGVDGVGRVALGAARAQEALERRGVDAAVDGLARLVRRGGEEGRELQSGKLHEYLRDTVAGAAAVGTVIALAAIG